MIMFRMLLMVMLKIAMATKKTVENFEEWMINPIQGGGGLISPPCHVFAYTHVSMRIWVLIFCDFSSFLVWKRLQDFRLNKMSPFSQEK